MASATLLIDSKTEVERPEILETTYLNLSHSYSTNWTCDSEKGINLSNSQYPSCIWGD